MNTPISFELAKALKEKGFDIPQLYFYIGGDLSWKVDNTRCRNQIEGEYAAPTIAEVIMWLYEKHGIWIQVKPGGKLESWDYIIQKKDNNFAVPYFEIKQHKCFFDSPTEAYEAAILYCLKENFLER